MCDMTVMEYILKSHNIQTYTLSRVLGAIRIAGTLITSVGMIMYCHVHYVMQILLGTIGIVSAVGVAVSITCTGHKSCAMLCLHEGALLLMIPILTVYSFVIADFVSGIWLVQLCVFLFAALCISYYKNGYRMNKAIDIDDRYYIPHIEIVLEREEKNRLSLRANWFGILFSLAMIGLFVLEICLNRHQESVYTYFLLIFSFPLFSIDQFSTRMCLLNVFRRLRFK